MRTLVGDVYEGYGGIWKVSLEYLEEYDGDVQFYIQGLGIQLGVNFGLQIDLCQYIGMVKDLVRIQRSFEWRNSGFYSLQSRKIRKELVFRVKCWLLQLIGLIFFFEV